MRWLTSLMLSLAASAAFAQTGGSAAPGVSAADIAAGLNDPTRWLTFSGDYTGQRHSPLKQITPRNVRRLVPQWTFQSGTYARGRGFETTPLALDGVLYVTGPNGYAWALDARTGRPFWEYRRTLPDDLTYGNDALLALRDAHPDRIRGYVCVNPNYPAHAEAEIRRCISEGMIGIKLAASRRATDPLLNPICALAKEFGVPVLHHIWQHRRRDWPGQEASDAVELAILGHQYRRVAGSL